MFAFVLKVFTTSLLRTVVSSRINVRSKQAQQTPSAKYGIWLPWRNPLRAHVLSDIEKELEETAAALVRPGMGLIACDESTGTVGKRLESIGVKNTEDNRRNWRNLLFTTPGLGQYISGAILYEETLFQNDPKGKPFVDLLKENGIIPGIKVDRGLKPLERAGRNLNGETWCSGLDDLPERAPIYRAQGARFAKWRAALRIDSKSRLPSDLAIKLMAEDMGRYARICQVNGLVPILEPEILMDGAHNLETVRKVQRRVMKALFAELKQNHVRLKGCLLKPSMIAPGLAAKKIASPRKIARKTVLTLHDFVPRALPGVIFLSGGLTEEDATICLNEVNKFNRKRRSIRAQLTFSFSRALQASTLKTWGGKRKNVQKAQDQLLARAMANSQASLGKYVPASQPSTQESHFLKFTRKFEEDAQRSAKRFRQGAVVIAGSALAAMGWGANFINHAFD